MHIPAAKIPDFLRLTPDDLRAMERDKVVRLREYFTDSGYKHAVIGLSGGVDSALSCALIVAALGGGRVYPVRLPYHRNNDESMAIALEVADRLGVPEENLLTVDITASVSVSAEMMSAFEGGDPKLRLGNIAARTRMIALMDLCSAYGALLVGTENLTEHYLAYFTIGGDQISSVEPIRDLWKTQVFQLGAHLGLPESVLNRAPSAELWPGQTDEDELMVPYLHADIVLACDRAGNDPCQYGVTADEAARVRAHVCKMAGKRDAPHILPPFRG